MEFLEIVHIKEVIVVILSHICLNIKNFKIMEIIKTIIAHLSIGYLLTKLSIAFITVAGPVGFVGRLCQLNCKV